MTDENLFYVAVPFIDGKPNETEILDYLHDSPYLAPRGRVADTQIDGEWHTVWAFADEKGAEEFREGHDGKLIATPTGRKPQ